MYLLLIGSPVFLLMEERFLLWVAFPPVLHGSTSGVKVGLRLGMGHSILVVGCVVQAFIFVSIFMSS